ncbi:vacuolar membrane protein [Teratosphaeria destructans]|uniref:Vacuolar membrane protein n=1 Tax=Teratosphaeria destructans TaxID=418781 RepID=A0A9W7W5Y9_9PEZI|nr:vacuolar membrane protein [Teratosphaeria destructans]
MASLPRRLQMLVLLTVMASAASAQLSDVPDLSTATQTTATTATSDSASATSDSTSGTSTGTSATTTGSSSGTATSSASISHLSNIPTIAGASIPTIVIPYTAGAPFMQKSSLPEGTVFIAVGACLAFLGACVLLWRGLVAWSVNRSVRRAALASLRGESEKNGTSTWGGSSGYGPLKDGLYKDAGSNMSLDALNKAGKPIGKSHHFSGNEVKRESTPPSGLFFSPTAQAVTGAHTPGNRASVLLPAGYYASPAAQAAGGAQSTTIGGASLAPYAQRHSMMNHSPPGSPGHTPQSRASTGMNYRASSREHLGSSASRDGYSSARNSYMDGTPRNGGRGVSSFYMQPGNSSLMVDVGAAGARGGFSRESTSDLGGSRAPSAYLEDLFENHGQGPRERF